MDTPLTFLAKVLGGVASLLFIPCHGLIGWGHASPSPIIMGA